MIKRIIPRIEFKGPNLIKGLEFEGNRCLGTLDHTSNYYLQQNETLADEIFYYDIVASLYEKRFNFEVFNKKKFISNIPVTFCGGFQNLDDIEKALEYGADKVSINSFLFKDIRFLRDAVKKYGTPTIISNIEYYHDGNNYILLTEYGRSTVVNNIWDWILELQENGVGEINLFDVKKDGYGEGVDIDSINELSREIKVPFIVGCGFGNKNHVHDVLKNTDCSGVSIASLFHYSINEKMNRNFASYDGPELRSGKDIDSGNVEFIKNGYGGFKDLFVEPCNIKDLKEYLFSKNISVRI